MKKLLLVLVCIAFSTGIYAQSSAEDSLSSGRNDVLVDPIMLIAVPAINVSYERLVSKESGIGVNAIIGLQGDMKDFMQFSPYYRMYFGRKYASGFFLEGFIPLTVNTEDYYDYSNPYSNPIRKTDTTVGVGIGVGGKWIAKKHLLFEVSGGVARRFTSNEDLSPLTGKIMGGIGYRF